ncbi:MAG: nucleotidyltransferase domain-containing protein [Planctomycetota bacterium]|jgi:predicted nucleotidyltransferase|nr:nucleotidyltransferase domain-containing protein [Planctomycetota bacterium]
MCNPATLNLITRQIAAAAAERLGERLETVLLYGSYARGDYDKESDIDIMILAHTTRDEAQKIERMMVSTVSAVSVANDVTVSAYVVDCATFYRWLNVIPFYQNVLKDGIKINLVRPVQ